MHGKLTPCRLIAEILMCVIALSYFHILKTILNVPNSNILLLGHFQFIRLQVYKLGETRELLKYENIIIRHFKFSAIIRQGTDQVSFPYNVLSISKIMGASMDN